MLAALVTWLLFAVPHVTYHLGNLGPYDTADTIGNMVTLALTVIVPVAAASAACSGALGRLARLVGLERGVCSGASRRGRGCAPPRSGSRAPTRRAASSRWRAPCRRAWAAGPARRRRTRRRSCRRRSRAGCPARSRARSVIGTWPRTHQSPLASRRTPATAGSVSSAISPTTSSTMSSMVTMPGGAAVLVDHHGERHALALEVAQQVVQRLGLGHDVGVLDARLDRGLGALDHQPPGQRVVVHDAADAVGVAVLGDHQARVAGVDAAAQRLLGALGRRRR